MSKVSKFCYVWWYFIKLFYINIVHIFYVLTKKDKYYWLFSFSFFFFFFFFFFECNTSFFFMTSLLLLQMKKSCQGWIVCLKEDRKIMSKIWKWLVLNKSKKLNQIVWWDNFMIFYFFPSKFKNLGNGISNGISKVLICLIFVYFFFIDLLWWGALYLY